MNNIITPKTRLHCLLLFICLFAMNHVYAYPAIISPLTLGNPVGPGVGGGYHNSARIDYLPFCGSCLGTPYQLTAIVQDDGTNPATLTIEDKVSGSFIYVTVSLGIGTGTFPDVCLGNNITASGAYLASVIYTDPLLNDVYVVLYSITGQGTGTLSVTYASGPTLISSGYNLVTDPAHIDIISQYSTLYPLGGLPQCDLFVMTWHENTNVGIYPAGIYGALGSLSGSFPTSVTQISSSTTAIYPDVAGVERDYVILPGTLGFDLWGLFTYIDGSNIYEQEWDISTSTVYAATTVGSGTFVGWPRIDAIDDHYNNRPTGTNAYYDICVSQLVSAAPHVFTYSSLSTGYDVCSGVPGFSTTQDSENPTVACGPGNNYAIAFSTYGTYTTYMSVQIDWLTGNPTSGNLEIIPFTTPTFPYTNYDYVSLSGTCNTESYGTQYLFACWDDGGFLYDKATLTVLTFGWKPASISNITGQTNDWKVWPNPATDHLTLAVPAGMNMQANIQYSITDIGGRQFMMANINEPEQQINISNLAPGIYLLHIFGDPDGKGTKEVVMDKFIKE